MWFTEPNKIGRITPQGQSTEFPLPNQDKYYGLTSGPDGKLWFTESAYCGGSNDSIVRMTPKGSVTVFPVPYNYPIGITAGPQRSMWFAGFGDFSGVIGKVTTR